MQGFEDERVVFICFVFLRLTRKFKMAAKKHEEAIFLKKSPVNSPNNLQLKNYAEIALSCTVSEIIVLLRFVQKLNMAAKNGRTTIFGKTRQ